MEPDVPPRTWKRAKWAWKLFSARLAEHNGDFDQALRLLDEAAEVKALRAEYPFQRAVVLLKSQRLQDAQSAFAQLRKELGDRDDPDARYLKRYCTGMLGTIAGNPGSYSMAEKETRDIPCKARLRRKFSVGFHRRRVIWIGS